MDERIKPIYREIEERFVKICWTHKIQEIQAELYLAKYNRIKLWMAIANGVTSTSAFVTVVTSALNSVNASWVWPTITSIIAIISTVITLKYKDEGLEDKAMACKQYAAKCRNLRNMYEALLADAKADRYNIDILCQKRDLMTDMENELFSVEIAPHTSSDAVLKARKALLENKDTQTEDHEIKAIVPTQLQDI